MLKPIYNITPFTLLDYPHKTACILWFAGCNMRCQYCYNPEIVFGKGNFDFQEILLFLNKRKKLLQGVVLSGGECTIHKDIINIITEIKKLGFQIKLDTNGTQPRIIKKAIELKLIDYIALDFKGLNQYTSITKNKDFHSFEKTLKYLIKINFQFEVRTTFHSDLISINELNNMANYLNNIGYKNTYYIQNFINQKETIYPLNDSLKIDISKIKLNNFKIEIR